MSLAAGGSLWLLMSDLFCFCFLFFCIFVCNASLVYKVLDSGQFKGKVFLHLRVPINISQCDNSMILRSTKNEESLEGHIRSILPFDCSRLSQQPFIRFHEPNPFSTFKPFLWRKVSFATYNNVYIYIFISIYIYWEW